MISRRRFETSNNVAIWPNGGGHLCTWGLCSPPMTADSEDSRPQPLSRDAPILRDQLDTFLEVTLDAVVFLDDTGRVEAGNWRLAEVLDCPVEEVVGEPIDALIAENHESGHDFGTGEEIRDTLVTEDEEATVLVPVRASDDSVRPMELRGAPVTSASGAVTGLIGIVSPVTDELPDSGLLERQRDEFALFNQILRHDIRNDANLILEITRGLRRDDPDPELDTMLEQLEGGARRIVDLTERARELIAALEALDSERVPIELEPILTEEVAKASTISPKVSVILEDDPPDVEVLANDMLGSVFRNLLSNAIHHNDADEPEVSVRTELNDDAVTVSVADNGPGVPSGVEEMVREGNVALDGTTNVGFGLYIVTTLLDRFDGRLTMEGNDPRGTIFHATLELADLT